MNKELNELKKEKLKKILKWGRIIEFGLILILLYCFGKFRLTPIAISDTKEQSFAIRFLGTLNYHGNFDEFLFLELIYGFVHFMIVLYMLTKISTQDAIINNRIPSFAGIWKHSTKIVSYFALEMYFYYVFVIKYAQTPELWLPSYWFIYSALILLTFLMISYILITFKKLLLNKKINKKKRDRIRRLESNGSTNKSSILYSNGDNLLECNENNILFIRSSCPNCKTEFYSKPLICINCGNIMGNF